LPAPGEVNAAMHGFAQFYALYLNDGLTPKAVLARHPALAGLWYDEPEHQYGRPARYFQHVQALNVEAAWERLAVPALLLWGEYDWIMGRDDQECIADIVRKRNPQQLKYVIYPKMNHDFEIFADPVRAFKEEGGRYEDGPAEMIVAWLHEQQGQPPAR
jgi:pimeloyl-ACP methyl ester carboxylesterase